ncbi:MAG: ATP-binding protein [Patescibacteria group bacterium]
MNILSSITSGGNIDILLIGLMAIGIGTLGIVAYFSDTRSITNQAFLAAAFSVIGWGVFNLAVFRLENTEVALWTLRGAVFLAVWHAFFSFLLFFVFPQEKVRLPLWFYAGVLPFAGIVSFLTLTPLIFESVSGFTAGVANVTNGPAIPLFGLATVGFHGAGLLFLFLHALKQDRQKRPQFWLVLLGASITYLLIILFNFVGPAILGNATYAPYAGLFTFPYIVLTTYAIIKHHLLNVRILSTEIFASVLAGIALVELVAASDLSEMIFRTAVFVSVLGFGFLLIQSVIREVRLREQVQALATQLTKANGRLRELDRQKSEFLSIASHQLRTPLAAIRGYASLLIEGSYGILNPEPKEVVENIFTSSSRMAQIVEDFLNVSKIEQGRLEYRLTPTDLQKLVQASITELTMSARNKGLDLSYVPQMTAQCMVQADAGKLQHVISNLVDNSIKYTAQGSITVGLSCDVKRKTASIQIKDTGIGIPKESLNKLFDKFVRARNAKDINVTGSGLGLYVAKEMIQAHRGVISVFSDGEGKGSTFVISLPTI